MNELFKELTVAACETQPVTAEGLRAAVAGCSDIRFLGNTRSLNEVFDLTTTQKPDVVIVDKAHGTQAILDVITRVREMGFSTAFIVWANAITEAEAVRLLQQGARGILRKISDVQKLVACIRAVGQGTTWMESNVFRESSRKDGYPRSELTGRERQVMELVEQGMKNKEIARELGIRPGTVKIHLKHIFEKTGVRGRYGLALSGLRHRGVITLMTV